MGPYSSDAGHPSLVGHSTTFIGVFAELPEGASKIVLSEAVPVGAYTDTVVAAVRTATVLVDVTTSTGVKLLFITFTVLPAVATSAVFKLAITDTGDPEDLRTLSSVVS